MSWIVVNTKSKCEKKATLNLIRQGFNVFYPKMKKTKLLFNKISQSIGPLFPGYVFVNLKKNQCWSKINYTFGVSSVLKNQSALYFLPKDVIENIKKKCDLNDVVSKTYNFQNGKKIKILKGNLCLDAVFDEYIDSKRSYVFLNLLLNNVRAKIENKYLCN